MPLTSATDPRRLAGASRIVPSAPRRPGETYVRPDLELPTLREIAIAAAEASVPVDVAATLIAEASLLLERLSHHRLSGALGLLDRAAGSSRVTRALSSGDADYLRALSCRSWRRQVAEIDLPTRVHSRLGDEIEARLAHTELLESAIRWETAALLCGRTVGNWGSDVVLGGFR